MSTSFGVGILDFRVNAASNVSTIQHCVTRIWVGGDMASSAVHDIYDMASEQLPSEPCDISLLAPNNRDITIIQSQ